MWATVDRFRYELVIDKDLVFKLFFKFQVILNDDDEDDNDGDGNDDVQGGQMIITINEWGWVSYEELRRSRRVLSVEAVDRGG